MKVLFVFAALCISGIMGFPTQGQIATIFNSYEPGCLKSVGISQAEGYVLKNGRFRGITKAGSCFLQCIMYNDALTDANGNILDNAVRAFAPILKVSSAVIEALIKACSKTYSTDACENGAQRAICFYNYL